MKLTIHREDEIYRIVDFVKDLGLDIESEFSCFLGRSKDCYVYLDSRQISREHLKISFKKWDMVGRRCFEKAPTYFKR